MVIAGAVVGMFITYFLAGIIYLSVFGSRPAETGEECTRGMAYGLLSLLLGTILGGIAGGVSTYKSFTADER
jgi:hypothetical protein